MLEKSDLRNSRRSLFQNILGTGAAAAALPLFSRLMNSSVLSAIVPAAHAENATGGVRPGQGDIALIRAATAAVVPMAEWEQRSQGAEAVDNQNRIAQGTGAIAKAPATASHYVAKAYEFPSGTFRVLSWAKGGGPVFHQVTFETEIFVLQGTLTLTPLYGIPGKPITVGAGDAICLLGGVLSNMSPTSDTIILQAFVSTTTKDPKGTVIRGKDLRESPMAEWMEKGQPMTARTTAEIARAPANAARFVVKRYAFDGNSLRLVSLPKGVKTNSAAPIEADTLIYITKGRLRRTEGSGSFELAAGDAFRERRNAPGAWEALENSQFIATDAPVLPTDFAPAMIPKTSGLNIAAILINGNGRSYSSFVNIPMKKISESESISEHQPGVECRIGYRDATTQQSRSSKDYVSDAGPYEMHVGGNPHFVGLMAGHLESTHQDGSVWRLSPGDFNFICPGGLHHSNYKSEVRGVMINLVLPGTPADTRPPTFR